MNVNNKGALLVDVNSCIRLFNVSLAAVSALPFLHLVPADIYRRNVCQPGCAAYSVCVSISDCPAPRRLSHSYPVWVCGGLCVTAGGLSLGLHRIRLQASGSLSRLGAVFGRFPKSLRFTLSQVCSHLELQRISVEFYCFLIGSG